MTTELCACGCGRPKSPKHRGWSRACYFRWYRAGKPKDGPPAPRNGPEYSAALREEVLWLVGGGESVEYAAARIGVTVETAESYVASQKPVAECAHHGCASAAISRKWCEEHKDAHALYLRFRDEGVGRHGAAFRVGVHVSTTYLWEPGRDGRGRPARPVTPSPAADPSRDTPKPPRRPPGRPPKPRVTVTAKRCAGCWAVKPAEEFTPDRRAADGLYASCRGCCNRRRRSLTKAVAT